MKKEKKIILIGEEFKENKKIDTEIYKDFKSLRQCFDRWSDRKENIYNYYSNLLNNNCDSVLKYGIRSYNCNFINLHAIIEKDNKKYYLLITPSHNYYKELED